MKAAGISNQGRNGFSSSVVAIAKRVHARQGYFLVVWAVLLCHCWLNGLTRQAVCLNSSFLANSRGGQGPSNQPCRAAYSKSISVSDIVVQPRLGAGAIGTLTSGMYFVAMMEAPAIQCLLYQDLRTLIGNTEDSAILILTFSGQKSPNTEYSYQLRPCLAVPTLATTSGRKHHCSTLSVKNDSGFSLLCPTANQRRSFRVASKVPPSGGRGAAFLLDCQCCFLEFWPFSSGLSAVFHPS